MIYEYHKCQRCLAIVKLYKDLDPNEVFNETFLRLQDVKTPFKDHVGMFYIISRSSARFLRNKTDIEKTKRVFESWDTKQTPYQDALDSYLQNNDDTYSRVVEMYLLEPNLTKISKDTKIKYYHLREILENALTRIGFEYLKLKQ